MNVQLNSIKIILVVPLDCTAIISDLNIKKQPPFGVLAADVHPLKTKTRPPFLYLLVVAAHRRSLGVYNSKPRPTLSTLLQESTAPLLMRRVPHATSAWQPAEEEPSARRTWDAEEQKKLPAVLRRRTRTVKRAEFKTCCVKSARFAHLS